MLPYRFGGKLTFPLCRSCLEHGTDLPLHDKRVECPHSDKERALTGTWCTTEVEKVLEMDYRMLRIHKVCKFGEDCRGLFASYVDTWLQFKTDATGWPDDCITPAQREAYVADYKEKEGIRLDPTNIEKNPGLRSLAKLMLNSLWGKFGQRENIMQVKAFYDPNLFRLFMDTVTSDASTKIGWRSSTGPKQAARKSAPTSTSSLWPPLLLWLACTYTGPCSASENAIRKTHIISVVPVPRNPTLPQYITEYITSTDIKATMARSRAKSRGPTQRGVLRATQLSSIVPKNVGRVATPFGPSG